MEIKPESPEFKCRLCARCDGKACAGELPGMGGVFGGQNHILNCAGWKKIYSALSKDKITAAENGRFFFRLAPITGAKENVGWPDEDSFYRPFFEFAAAEKNLFGIEGAGCALSVGDGCPDSKLLLGLDAVRALNRNGAFARPSCAGTGGAGEAAGAERAVLAEKAAGKEMRAAVFFKPYPQEKLFERIEWSHDVAECCGVDTDAFNIITMRNKVHLEKKTAAQLRELKARAKVPFVIKGICTQEDIELVRETLPDAVVVSNHGGRVERPLGSTAEFLKAHIGELKNYCGKVWVDGGIRTKEDAVAAAALGADEILLGRPLITAFLKSRIARNF